MEDSAEAAVPIVWDIDRAKKRVLIEPPPPPPIERAVWLDEISEGDRIRMDCHAHGIIRVLRLRQDGGYVSGIAADSEGREIHFSGWPFAGCFRLEDIPDHAPEAAE